MCASNYYSRAHVDCCQTGSAAVAAAVAWDVVLWLEQLLLRTYFIYMLSSSRVFLVVIGEILVL